MIYAAIFSPREEGFGYTVEFPDLPGCLTEGDDAQEAMRLARDALHGYILALRDLKRPVPVPSDPQRLDAPEGGFLALVDGPAEPSPAVRINVSIDAALLKRIDEAAQADGMTRSGLLAAGAKMLLASR